MDVADVPAASCVPVATRSRLEVAEKRRPSNYLPLPDFGNGLISALTSLEKKKGLPSF